MNKNNKLIQNIISLAVVTGMLLLIPFMAMQFTNEINWTLSDFVFAGTLLYGFGLTYLLVTRKSEKGIYRIAVGFALASGLFLIWTNMAVGLIGSEDNEINLLYFLVILAGVIGAFLSRFRSQGLAITLFSMAGIQFLIAIYALFTGMADLPESSVVEIFLVNGLFILLFVISGGLFWQIEENSGDSHAQTSL